MTALIPQITTVTGQNPGLIKSKMEKFNPQSPLALANTPDEFLELAAKQEAYQQFNNSPTRKITNVVGTSIPFIDSFMAGAITKGSASSKLAGTVGRGSDWGVFAVAVWLYNKSLGKAYETFPGMRKFKENHPTITFVGELVTGVALARGAINLYRKGFKKGLKTTPEQFFTNLFKKAPKVSETVAAIYKPVEKIASKIPERIKKYAGAVITLSLAGLILKNIYDVRQTKKRTDKNLVELKNQRYQIALNLANKSAQA